MSDTDTVYLVLHEYVGPNPDDHIDDDWYEVSTTPAVTNLSKEPSIDGWLGVTDDWSSTALGEYTNLEAAQIAMEQFGGYRDYGWKMYLDEDTVGIYRVGALERWGEMTSVEWAHPAIVEFVTESTTNEAINNKVVELVREAAEYGGALDQDAVHDYMIEYRSDLAYENMELLAASQELLDEMLRYEEEHKNDKEANIWQDVIMASDIYDGATTEEEDDGVVYLTTGYTIEYTPGAWEPWTLEKEEN